MNGISLNQKGLHLVHLDVNSFLPEIGEICYKAERANAAVVGITASKLDESIFQSEIQTDNYGLLHVIETKMVEVLLAI